jgi:hypothetical protein
MDDNVVALRVISVSQNIEGWMSAGIGSVNLVNRGVCAGLNAVFENVLLMGIVVAATAGDEEDAERGWRSGQV